jgi:TPR repeat protein
VGSLPCPWCDATLDAEADQCPACGRPPIVCEKYRVYELLGRGGMGVVYAARSTEHHRGKKKHRHDEGPLAVKIIAPPKDDDWTAWELFERSSRVLQQLHHEGLPTVHAFERTETGRLVLVREAFDGGTLQQRVADSDDRIEPERLRELLHRMLELLEYLQGLVPPVIHRDIKPSNVMFRTKDDWKPVLVDFDTIVSRRSGLTIVGTPGYAAPEQFAADASPASDVYGLGATMLFVATHTDADDLPHEHGRFVLDGLLPSLDEKLASVLGRMVEPDLSKRYATARDVIADLDARRPKPAPPPASPPPTPRSASRERSRFRARWLLVVPAVCGLWLCGRAMKHRASESAAAAAQTATNAADERACEKGDRDKCFTVALRYDDGTDGVEKDYARAASLYDRGCKLGHAACCNNLGVDYQHGYGVAADVPRAMRLYTGACDQKNALGCRNLGLLYQKDAGTGAPYDIGKALALFGRGCDLEDGESCNDLGWLYESGSGTPMDLKKAASLYGLACDHGYLYGCRNSGIAYETADGVDRDDRRAVALFKRACCDDEKSGCLELGRMTLDGRGTAADPARAADAFETGCDDGWLEACDELARLYEHGVGVKRDVVRARLLYAQACDGGVVGSCREMRAAR